MRRPLMISAVFLGLVACGGSDEPNLLNISQPRAEGPDEFAILPAKPLQLPEDVAALPPPTPGGANLTDPTPLADAAVAMGGRPEVLTRRSTDGALISYAGRYGIEDDIRPRLAAADLEYRRQNDGRLLERLFNVNVYFRAYEQLSLDQYAELERLRRAGIRTSAVPPDPSRDE
ncbi:MAG: DUF3035 domain-containing protein [Silicimonas sp.]|nr:DUF3035 domain-containing protein [Silicimonas sp.]NND16949.1 DUF3035 domain-containing protein [Silicimonas sp.]NND22254.1 DUF3035 domain-containing protein [Silicimonas sp.]NNL34716.1 DUF3035 domain-containing protein [Silicimonas sp.]NNL71842.1 DUF3035 domain-containing protein [Silicimonas sp.]